MALRIRDLDALSSISKSDIFEIEKHDDGKSYKVSGEALTSFFTNVNNGGYRGIWPNSRSLDDATWADTGVWYYGGENPIVGGILPAQGIIEIICHSKPDETQSSLEIPTEGYTIIQKYMNGVYFMVRMIKKTNDGEGGTRTTAGAWKSTVNKNDCIIWAGESNEDVVNFRTALSLDEDPFTSAPTVILTPRTTNGYVNIINLTDVNTTGFTVQRFQSATSDFKVVETIQTTESGQETTTKTDTIQTIGQWSTSNVGFSYRWVAIQNS